MLGLNNLYKANVYRMYIRNASIPLNYGSPIALRYYPPMLCGQKNKNLNFSGIFPIYIGIILRAGTSIYASSMRERLSRYNKLQYTGQKETTVIHLNNTLT